MRVFTVFQVTLLANLLPPWLDSVSIQYYKVCKIMHFCVLFNFHTRDVFCENRYSQEKGKRMNGSGSISREVIHEWLDTLLGGQ